MQRHEPVIQLANHVKNKLKQHQQLPAVSPFIDSSDEFIEINSTDDENDSPFLIPPEHITRHRRDTYTTYDTKPSSGPFFTDGKSGGSLLREEYKKQQECEECLRRNRVIDLQRQDLIRISNQNKQLNHQLRSSILLNQQYESESQKLKHHLNKVNSHLYEYQRNFDHLKQKIISEKKTTNLNIDDDHDDNQEEHEQEDETIDHIKRLRYEINMYNRLVAAREKQEAKTEQTPISFLF